MPPEIRYARNGDTHIAYAVFGDGPIDIVISPGFVSHVEMLLGDPTSSAWLDRFGAIGRVVFYDKPGTGASDPITQLPTLEERLDDLEAVITAAGVDRFSLYAYSEGGPTACLYAATHPERVDAIGVWGSLAAGSLVPRQGFDLTDEQRAWLVTTLTGFLDEWGTGSSLDIFAPSFAAGRDQAREAWGLVERQGASPGMARQLMQAVMSVDARGVLPSISAPTLIQHRTGDRAVPLLLGKELAHLIPDARLITYDGDDHIPWLNFDQPMDDLEEFFTGTRPQRSGQRALATVLFTDIVDSTARAAEAGDAEWRRLIELHDRVARSAIEREGGRVIKSLGDGCMAELPGPAAAVRAADTYRQRLAEVGLTVRSGVHTGECERVEDDLLGIAVNIAARVADTAGPGEILVSATVPGLVVGSGIVFEARGAHELKGIPDPWDLHAVTSV